MEIQIINNTVRAYKRDKKGKYRIYKINKIIKYLKKILCKIKTTNYTIKSRIDFTYNRKPKVFIITVKKNKKSVHDKRQRKKQAKRIIKIINMLTSLTAEVNNKRERH